MSAKMFSGLQNTLGLLDQSGDLVNQHICSGSTSGVGFNYILCMELHIPGVHTQAALGMIRTKLPDWLNR